MFTFYFTFQPEMLGTEWQYLIEWYPGGSSNQHSLVKMTSQLKAIAISTRREVRRQPLHIKEKIRPLQLCSKPTNTWKTYCYRKSFHLIIRVS